MILTEGVMTGLVIDLPEDEPQETPLRFRATFLASEDTSGEISFVTDAEWVAGFVAEYEIVDGKARLLSEVNVDLGRRIAGHFVSHQD